MDDFSTEETSDGGASGHPATADSAPATASLPAPRFRVLPLIVASALFMETLDSSVLATSLPAMATSLHQSPITLKLAITSYLLALAVWLPASAWLADRFGARHIFRLAIIVFAVGSIGCGFSQTIGEIVAARIIQGVGGAMMVPVGRLIVLRSTPRRELVGALAMMTMPMLVGPLVGPLVGGFITTFFEWRWIFWVNVPIAVVGLVVATIYVPPIPGEAGTRFDLVGFTLTGFGVLSFVLGSTAVGMGDIPAVEALMIIGVGVALIVAYLLHSRRHEKPLLDVSLFRVASFRVALIGGALVRIGVGGVPFLLPLLMQYGFGMTPFQSGAVTFVGAIGSIGLKAVSTRVIRLFGFRRLLLGNAALAALSIAIFAVFTPATPVVLMYGVLVVAGFVRSMQMTAINVLAFVDVPPRRMSQGSTLASVFQEVSNSLGVSAAALALESQIGPGGAITTPDFFWPFIILGAITFTGVPLFWSLRADVGREVSGHLGHPAV